MFRNFTEFGPEGAFHGGPQGRFGRHFRQGFGRRFARAASRAGQRGNLRYDILALLADQPRHGYDIMLEIEKERGFRPSPGSIYPALQMLEDGGFVRSKEIEGKRVYEISETGLTLLADYKENGGFDSEPGEDAARVLFGRGLSALRGLIGAAKQVARTGNPETVERVAAVLDRARREIYTILAEET
jgi:DNA-binding PadR family transcriptional regulator